MTGVTTSTATASSPRTWGCSIFPAGTKYLVSVLPTHVGVLLADDR